MTSKLRTILKGLKDTFQYKTINPFLFQLYSSKSTSKFSDLYLVSRIKHEAHLLEKATKNSFSPGRGIARSSYLIKLTQELKQRDHKYSDILLWANNILSKFNKWTNERCSQHSEGTYNLNKTPFLSVPSIRFWDNRIPSKEDILKCVEAGQLAPASCNRQAFLIRITCNNDLSNTECGASNVRMFQSVPYRIFIFINMRNYTEKYSCFIDLGMFAQNFILKAKSLSLGCCCCYASEHIENGQKYYLNKFNLGREYYCGLSILVGYPNEVVEKPPRVNVNSIVKFMNI